MTVSAVCPVCSAPQQHGIACSACCDRLERDLGDVASIVADLDIAMSKQARIGNASGPSGLARERTPINVGAMNVADNLGNVLTTWARDVLGGRTTGSLVSHPAKAGACVLLSHIDAVRRHPAVVELTDEIHDAIAQARRVVDRPADRIYLSQCMFEDDGVTCYAELYASPGASEVRCKVCGVTHPVAERRAWLMQRAEDMLFTPAEASQMLGEVGHITVSQASIRSYIHRGRILYRPPVTDKRFRLGDLLDILRNETSERRTA